MKISIDWKQKGEPTGWGPGCFLKGILISYSDGLVLITYLNEKGLEKTDRINIEDIKVLVIEE